jgi:subtilisin family serine protease
MPRRMSGTSAAAPQVAGLVALLFQAAAAGQAPTASDIRNLVLTGASKARFSAPPLRPNAHIEADSRRRVKQGASTVRPHLTGSGKINWPKSRELLP